VTKYKQRQGWSHIDALRLCHATPVSEAHALIFKFIVKGLDAAKALGAVAATEPVTLPKAVEGVSKREREQDSPAARASVLRYLTDNETWAGDGTTASEALCQYRAKAHGVADAKLVVVGMASNGFTVADPTDAGQLDCVGFDTATPAIIAAFAGSQC